MTTTPEPKVYFESKMKVSLYGAIVVIPLLAILAGKVLSDPGGMIYAKTLIAYIVPFLILFILFFITYPSSALEIRSDRFVYRKGKHVFGANWSDVTLIAFQVTRGTRGATPSSFVIRTNNHSTKLIDTKLLKLKNSADYKLNLVDFVTDLESVSGQKVRLGDVSVNRFSGASFLDFLKGLGMSSARTGQ